MDDLPVLLDVPDRETGDLIADSIPLKKSCSKKWAALIKKIYEVDLSPLFAPYENNFDHQ